MKNDRCNTKELNTSYIFIHLPFLQVEQLDKQLADYKSISNSSSYELLVEQYGRLKAEIEGKMWALKELKNTEGMSNDHLNDFSTTEYSFSE